MTWHAQRFEAREDRVRFDCMVCARPMYFPQCKVGKYKTCGDECSAALKAQPREARRRDCLVCGKSFIPRQVQITNGGGQYCSKKCGMVPMLEASRKPEVLAKISAKAKAQYAAGIRTRKKGPDHPDWKGGKVESRKRAYPRSLITAKAWRQRNPEKVREVVMKRRGIGRLPKGTVNRIGEAQRWKCAICRKGIKKKYHMDHVMPLAKGGKHEPLNIQLLCPSCNVRKSDKHPTDYMQERGFLL